MSALRTVYHLARADFYERIRRYSFLVIMALSLFLGYQVAIGNTTLALGHYRGEFNSAWVGAMVSVVATFFIGFFGFYLVKGSVARDRETGVGQIMATTPLTRPAYMLGKWLSNLSVLMTMVAVLALVGLGLQIWQGENTQLDLWAFLSPFLFIVLPCMGLVAALAVLFESISFLQAGFGNFVYFAIFITSFPLLMETLGPNNVAFEPLGVSLLEQDMGQVARSVYPDYQGGFMLGPSSQQITGTFTWTGIDWTPVLVLQRFTLLAIAVFLTLAAALFFDRFDPSRTKPRRQKALPAQALPEPAVAPPQTQTLHLTSLSSGARRFSFFGVLQAEIKMLLKGQRWWWYGIAAGLIIACSASPASITREFLLPLAWAWPALIWSALGNRERRHNVQQMVFSAPAPLLRQLPVQWLAGFIVAVLMGSGAAARFAIDGNMTGLLALLSGAIFIPSLALAAGVWSGSGKLFEVLYILILYIGPFNRVTFLDFTGASGTGRPEFFIPLSLVLVALAISGRAWQLRS